MIDKYSLIELKDTVITQGLERYLDKEISVKKGDYTTDDIQIIIDNILYYRMQNSKTINNFETFGIGSWMLSICL